MAARSVLVVVLVLFLALIGCSKKESAEQADSGQKTQSSEETAKDTKEPDFIVVQHILVGFEGSVPGKGITRSKDDAKELAYELLDRVKAGEDFDVLVSEYTDDSHPGIYKMANFDVQADMGQGVFARERMVAAFGDVGFPLDVGEVGLADYDPEKSQYGWHLIKRIE